MQRLLGILTEGEPVSGEGRDPAEKTSASAGLGRSLGGLWTWDAPSEMPQVKSFRALICPVLGREHSLGRGSFFGGGEFQEEHAAESANNCPGAGGIGSSSVLTTHHSTHMLSALGTSLTLLTLCPDLQHKGVTPTSWDTQKSKRKNKNKRKQCVNCEQGYSFQPEF